MQFKFIREFLVKLLRLVSGAIDRKVAERYPIVSNVLLEIDKEKHQVILTATDKDMQIQSFSGFQAQEFQIETSGQVILPFKKLYDICRHLPAGVEIECHKSANQVVLQSGYSKFVLSSMSIEDFPKISNFDSQLNFEMTIRELKSVIEQTAFSIADQDVRYFLNGMLFEFNQTKLNTVASDGHRMAISQIAYPKILGMARPFLKYLVPKKIVLEILRMLTDLEPEEYIEVAFSDHYICLRSQYMNLIGKLLEPNFPDYHTMLESRGKRELIIDRQLLKTACSRVSVLLTEKSKVVQLKLSKNLLTLVAINTDQDLAEEKLEVVYSDQLIQVGFNIRYLLDLLNVISTPFVKIYFSDPDESVFVTGFSDQRTLNDPTDCFATPTGTYILMPIRM